MPVREASEKIKKKKQKEKTKRIFRSVLLGAFLVHALAVLVIRRSVAGYFHWWADFGAFLLEYPAALPSLLIAIALLYGGISLWRDPNPDYIVYPDYPPPPDLRYTNDLYVGSAWTREGKQPGDLHDAEDEVLEPDETHLILREKGLFGNIHCKGGVGGGKTSRLIQPLVDQAIHKFPKPPPPDRFPKDKDGRYTHRAPSSQLSADQRREAVSRYKRAGLSGLTDYLRSFGMAPPEPEAPEDRDDRVAQLVGELLSEASGSTGDENPYAGMTEEEAEERYRELLEAHEQKKWGIFLIDPKGDLTEFAARSATLAGRQDDVIILSPDSKYTYNPLAINSNPLVQSEMVMDGIEAVYGQAIQQYWRGVMSEWLANALEILRVVDPTRVNFKSILSMARNEDLRTRLVAEADSVRREAQEKEEQLRRMGKSYHGIRVNPAAIEFFRDWDDEDSDPSLKRAVVSGLKAQAKFFVDDELAPFLCPEMPATFDGFDTMIDRGQIVILRMPLDTYGPVAKVLGILLLGDAQQAARMRINRPDMNQERVVLFSVDEISAYMNKLTKDFVAMNRQSRVVFLAAHQSQGQLIQHGDRSYETSFNDNFRTKISFNAPHAEAAKRESSIFGSRRVIREVWSESQSFRGVEQVPDSEEVKPVGKDTPGAGASVRHDEVDRAWFAPEDFLTLRTGECVVSAFDGVTTLSPRMVLGPAYYHTEQARSAKQLDVDLQNRPPHPVVFVPSGTRDYEYINSALAQVGYAIVVPLADTTGELVGLKLVTAMGTLIASLDVFGDIQEDLGDRLAEPDIVLWYTDVRACGLFLSGQLGLDVARPADLLSVAQDLGMSETTISSYHDLLRSVGGYEPSYSPLESWAFHFDVSAHTDLIEAEGRALLDIYHKLGDRLYEQGDEFLDSVVEATQGRVREVLSQDASPGDDPGDDLDPGTNAPSAPPDPDPDEGPDPGADAGSLDDDFAGDSVDAEDASEPPFDDPDDPFASETYPDDLSPEGPDEDAPPDDPEDTPATLSEPDAGMPEEALDEDSPSSSMIPGHLRELSETRPDLDLPDTYYESTPEDSSPGYGGDEPPAFAPLTLDDIVSPEEKGQHHEGDPHPHPSDPPPPTSFDDDDHPPQSSRAHDPDGSSDHGPSGSPPHGDGDASFGLGELPSDGSGGSAPDDPRDDLDDEDPDPLESFPVD